MALAPQLIIDADSHVTEPADVWTARVPSRYRDDVPRVVEQGPAGGWMLQDKPLTPVGVTAPAGWPTFPPEYPPTYEDCHPGAYDARDRLEYMDEAGIWAQVLYPNVGGFGSQNFLELDDEELKLLCVTRLQRLPPGVGVRGPNRRLLPVVATPFWDIEATVKEIERCVGLGARGILFTGEPQRYGLPVLGNRHWDPLWAVATRRRSSDPLPHRQRRRQPRASSRTGALRRARRGRGPGLHRGQPLFMKNGVQCSRPHHLGRAQPLPGPEVRVRRERDRLAAVHAGGDATTAGSGRSGPDGSASPTTSCPRSCSAGGST